MIVEYKTYYLSGSIVPQYMSGCQSLGIVCIAGKQGSIIEVKRIPGRNFETSEQAEQHGLELAKQWVDDHAKGGPSE
jgi:hypothetical protein